MARKETTQLDNITNDYLPNPHGNVHGESWGWPEATGDGLGENTRAPHPVFGVIPETTEYGGSDC